MESGVCMHANQLFKLRSHFVLYLQIDFNIQTTTISFYIPTLNITTPSSLKCKPLYLKVAYI